MIKIIHTDRLNLIRANAISELAILANRHRVLNQEVGNTETRAQDSAKLGVKGQRALPRERKLWRCLNLHGAMLLGFLDGTVIDVPTETL